MTQYIDKSALVTEIKKRMKQNEEWKNSCKGIDSLAASMVIQEDINIISLLDSLEVKETDIWHLQEKEDIYDAVKDWGLYKFACIMKDGTIQKFTGNLDEDCEGHINVHINGFNDDYDNVDDIVKWIEFKAQKGE